MPKDSFYNRDAIEGDGQPPFLTVAWGFDIGEVFLNDHILDRSGLNRLIRSLRKARDQTHGKDN